MKANCTIVLWALAVLFAAGCSKNISPEVPEDPDAWVTDLSKPVPIRFGSSNFELQTKGGFITDTTRREVSLGVIAVDVAHADWSSGPVYDSHYLFNAPAVFKSTAAGKGMIQFKEEGDEITKYYPIESKYNYTFYGYHVPESDTTVVNENESIRIEIPVGKEDILWAETAATTLTSEQNGGNGERPGFNAAYVRATRTASPALNETTGYFPEFTFDHKTAALIFHFKISGDISSEEQTTLANCLKIRGLRLEHEIPDEVEDKSQYMVFNRANLYVVTNDITGHESGSLEGIITPECDSLGLSTLFPEEGTQLQTGPEGVAIAPAFVVPFDPTYAKVVCKVDIEHSGICEIAMSFSSRMPGDNKFKAGHVYHYNIVFKSLEALNNINVNMTSFTDDEGTKDLVVGE